MTTEKIPEGAVSASSAVAKVCEIRCQILIDPENQPLEDSTAIAGRTSARLGLILAIRTSVAAQSDLIRPRDRN